MQSMMQHLGSPPSLRRQRHQQQQRQRHVRQQPRCCCPHNAGTHTPTAALRRPLLLSSQRHGRQAPRRQLAGRAVASDQPQQQGPPDPSQQEQQQQLEQQQLQLEQQRQQQVAAVAQGEAALAALEDDILDAQGLLEQEARLEAEALALPGGVAHPGLELAPMAWRRPSRNACLAMAAGLAAAGLLVAVGAEQLAAAGLRLGPGLQQQQAAVLVGCVGAGVLRAASLALFLAEGAALGELGSWRYQRVNVGLGLAAAGAAGAALAGAWAGGTAPWLPLLVALPAGTVAAACAWLAAGQARRGGGLYFASALGYGDVFEGCAATGRYLLYNVSCLPGLIMTGLAGLAALTGGAALAGATGAPAAAAASALPWLPASASGGAALGLLHRLLGAGLLLLGLQAWALAEFAARARDVTPEAAIKLAAARRSEEEALASGRLGPAPVHAPPARFALLHAGFFAAAAVQGWWLARGAGGGSGLGLFNAGDPLWGGLFWGVGLSAAYAAALAARLDYADIARTLLRGVDVAGGWVAAGAAVLFVDWTWITPIQRR